MAADGRLSLPQKCSCSIIVWLETTSSEMNMTKQTVYSFY